MTATQLVSKLLAGCDPVWAESEIRPHIMTERAGIDGPDWWIVLTLALAKQKRLILAEETCRYALSFIPQHQDAHFLLSHILASRDTARESLYSRQFQALRPRYRDHPRFVSIETVGRCNATCSFCPNPVLTRRHTAMDDELFHKIIADLTEIPQDHSFAILPNIVNEPLMDPKLFERCRYINNALPHASLTFFTNLSFLPPRFFENLATLRNINYWNVSFNAADPDEYTRIMGIPFERTVANINSLLRFFRDHPMCKLPLNISRVGDDSASDQVYLRTCASLFPDFVEGRDFLVQCKARTDWLGRVETTMTEIPYSLPCGAWFDINIFCDGRVPHCCMDAHGEFTIGDVRKQSVLEIYNNPSFRNLREHHSAREGIDPCCRCSLMQ